MTTRPDLDNIIHIDHSPSEASASLSEASSEAGGSQTDFTDLDTVARSLTDLGTDAGSLPNSLDDRYWYLP